MSLDELRTALETGEELEYHAMGVEQNAGLLPGPGWYPCRVDGIYASGNVEIAFTDPELDGLYVTVLKKNIPIAFRKHVDRNGPQGEDKLHFNGALTTFEEVLALE